MKKRNVRTTADREKNLSKEKLELRKLSISANRRMRALEKSNITTDAYKQATSYLSTTTRKRFKEDPLQMTTKEYKAELKSVRQFLDSVDSTKTGYNKTKRQVSKPRQQQPKQPKKKDKPKQKKKYDRKAGLSEARIKLMNRGKTANNKMRALESEGLITPAYKQAQAYLERTGRRRFSENPLNLTNEQYKQEKHWVEKFIKAKSSTKRGYLDTISKRDKTMMDKGFKEEDLDDLYKILNSSLYRSLLGNLESDQIIEVLKRDFDNQTIDFASLNLEDVGMLTNREKELINKAFNREIYEIHELDTEKGKNQDSLFGR